MAVTAASAARTEKVRVLVIDDNVDAADTLVHLLGVLGFESMGAHSGTAGLMELDRFRPDVVICDLRMPGMDGYHVAGQIRQRLGAAAPMLVAYTGFGSTADPQKSAAAGFSHQLSKPVEIGALMELLSNVRLGRAAGPGT